MNREMVQGGESRLGESPSLPVKKNKHWEYVGVRKLWGSMKKLSVEEVKKLGERVAVARIYSLTLSTLRTYAEDRAVHTTQHEACTNVLGGHI